MELGASVLVLASPRPILVGIVLSAFVSADVRPVTPFAGATGRVTFAPACGAVPGATRPLRSSARCTCDTWWSNDCGRAAGCLVVKKRCCWPPRAIVPALAGRLLAERACRVGTTGRFPVMTCPSLNSCGFTGVAATRPVPKRSAGTVETAWRRRVSVLTNRRFEYRLPRWSGANPLNPRPLRTYTFVMLTFVIFTVLKRERYGPYHG